MKSIQSLIIRHAPFWLQDCAVTFYNNRSYRIRRSGRYAEWREYFREMDSADARRLMQEAEKRLNEFTSFACRYSKWYASRAASELEDFPVLEKSELLENLDQITTVSRNEAVVSLTGGTTGASMKVYYTREDIQERNALLDHFRASYGYTLGEKVAWFSGKDLASQSDVSKGRCYRDDLINNIRFFSTFHINDRNFEYYWSALEKFKPRYMIGFPSSIYDLAVMARQRGLAPSYDVQAVFPTAETLVSVQRDLIGSVFNTRLVDQYASSEGAPFIIECNSGRLHIHPLSGVFEVVDAQGAPSIEGEVLVTSFSTRGTPLIRYRIGDRLRLADANLSCTCGSIFPLVEWIEGRASDFIWSPERGRVNLGNLSNSTKEVKGIRCFQVVQDELSSIQVRVVGGSEFDGNQEAAFLAALRLRTGDGMQIEIQRVDSIPRESSGKFRIVKNSIVGELSD